LEVAESLPQLRTTAQLVRDKLIRGDIRPEELSRLTQGLLKVIAQ
jgi:FdhE protein